jgi:hypothetical protein
MNIVSVRENKNSLSIFGNKNEVDILSILRGENEINIVYDGEFQGRTHRFSTTRSYKSARKLFTDLCSECYHRNGRSPSASLESNNGPIFTGCIDAIPMSLGRRINHTSGVILSIDNLKEILIEIDRIEKDGQLSQM